LPEPRSACLRVHTFKGIRHIHVAISLVQILFMQELDLGEMVLQRLLQ
jgi:hypothetical protein